jgi:hypothetical protein
VPAVLATLRLVVSGDATVAFPNGGCRVWFHRIVVLDGNPILRFDLHGRPLEGLCCFSSPMRLCFLRDCAALSLRVQIRLMRVLLEFDADERGRITRDLKLLRHYERNRLTTEADLIVVKRPEGRAIRRYIVFVFFIGIGERRAMDVREDIKHAGNCKHIGGLNILDPPLGDRGRDHEAVRKRGDVVFARIFGSTGDLLASLDARCRFAQYGAHKPCRSPPSLNPLVRLRLRRAAPGLGERAE